DGNSNPSTVNQPTAGGSRCRLPCHCSGRVRDVSKTHHLGIGGDVIDFRKSGKLSEKLRRAFISRRTRTPLLCRKPLSRPLTGAFNVTITVSVSLTFRLPWSSGETLFGCASESLFRLCACAPRTTVKKIRIIPSKLAI